MQTGLSNLDKFSYLGSFSGAVARNFDVKTSYGGVFADAKGVNSRLRVFFIGCGEQDFLWEGSVALHKALDGAGVKHVWHPGPGLHDWQVWRIHLHAFAPLLFR
jgi:S-formylglutathione hydrolase FrmB